MKISALEFRLTDNEAHARFLQDYRSDKLIETGRKTLALVKINDRWLMRQEQAAE